MKLKKYINGLTLIELMIAMAIMAIIMGGVVYILNATIVQTDFISSNSELNSYSKEIIKELEQGLYYTDNSNTGLKKSVKIIEGNKTSIKFLTYILKKTINPDTVTLKYNIKDSDTGTNKTNVFVVCYDTGNKERLIPQQSYRIDTLDTSILIFDTCLPGFEYNIFYLPELENNIDTEYITYEYSTTDKIFYRTDKYGKNKLPYTDYKNYSHLAVANYETNVPYFSFEISDGTDTDSVDINTSDSVTIINVKFKVYDRSNDKKSVKMSNQIFLEYKRN